MNSICFSFFNYKVVLLHQIKTLDDFAFLIFFKKIKFQQHPLKIQCMVPQQWYILWVVSLLSDVLLIHILFQEAECVYMIQLSLLGLKFNIYVALQFLKLQVSFLKLTPWAYLVLISWEVTILGLKKSRQSIENSLVPWIFAAKTW